MLTEWYRSGLAKAYSVFVKNVFQKSVDSFSVGNPRNEFENFRKKDDEFEKFLDEFKDEPWKNIRYTPKKKNYYNCKLWLNNLTSSKSKISEKKDIWDVINFGISDQKQCTICGKKGTKNNIVLTYPFERQVKNYFSNFNVNNRIHLCPICQRVCFYAFGNVFYNQSDDRVSLFFLSSDDYTKIEKISEKFHELRIPEVENNPYSNIRPRMGVNTYYPFEYLYSILFELYNTYPKERNEISSLLEEVKVELVSYKEGKGLSLFDLATSVTRLDKLMKIFTNFSEKIENMNKKRQDENKKPIDGVYAFKSFFNDLLIDGKKLEDKNRLREIWTKKCLNKYRVDYITLNEIVMSNISTRKKKYKFIRYYVPAISSILEVRSMEETEFFRAINGLGYHLGKKAEEEKVGENALWDIFRTRTPEDFTETLVRTQLKLRISLDLRKIEENKQRWRETKAVLLNGMANALFEGRGETNE